MGQLEPSDGVATRVRSRAELLRAGMTSSTIDYRLRSGRWERLAPQVYLLNPPVQDHDRLRAGWLHGGDGSAVSGQAALAAHGFSIPMPVDILVLVPNDCYVRSWGRIRIRRTKRIPRVSIVAEAHLAEPARAVVDYAVTLSNLDRVRALVGFAVQRNLCSPEAINSELEAGPRRGSKLLREALVDAGFGALSAPEARAGRLFREAGLSLVQNHPIRVGRKTRIADFFDVDRRAVIEIDSTEFHFSVADHDATVRRDQELQAGGYAVMHIKPSQLRTEPELVVFTVRRWLDGLEARR